MCVCQCFLSLIEPHYACISHTHVAVATKNVIYTWHYRTSSRLASSEVAYTILRKGREGKEILLHVDEMPLEEADHTNPTIDHQKNEKVGTTYQLKICYQCFSRKLSIQFAVCVLQIGALLWLVRSHDHVL